MYTHKKPKSELGFKQSTIFYKINQNTVLLSLIFMLLEQYFYFMLERFCTDYDLLFLYILQIDI